MSVLLSTLTWSRSCVTVRGLSSESRASCAMGADDTSRTSVSKLMSRGDREPRIGRGRRLDQDLGRRRIEGSLRPRVEQGEDESDGHRRRDQWKLSSQDGRILDDIDRLVATSGVGISHSGLGVLRLALSMHHTPTRPDPHDATVDKGRPQGLGRSPAMLVGPSPGRGLSRGHDLRHSDLGAETREFEGSAEPRRRIGDGV